MSYQTISDISEGIYKEKGSKFIATAIPVENTIEAKKHISEFKKKHHSARHHCFAYSIGVNREEYRVNDDGEPSGTAGKPIYGQLLSKNITNTIIIVARYFGGTKLGKGGLINAYKNAALNALNNNKIIKKERKEIYRLRFDYLEINSVMKIIKLNNIELLNQVFDKNCILDLGIKNKEVKKTISFFESIKNIKIEHLKNS